MHALQPPGWRITQIDRQDLETALFVRDACGVAPEALSIGIPPLAPAVPLIPPERGPASPDQVGRLDAWIASLLRTPEWPAPDIAAGEAMVSGWARQAASFGVPPQLPARWISGVRLEKMRAHRSALGAGRDSVRRAVEVVERELGHPLPAIHLDVAFLPVAGTWWLRTAPAAVLVGTALRADAESRAAILVPVIRELASAV